MSPGTGRIFDRRRRGPLTPGYRPYYRTECQLPHTQGPQRMSSIHPLKEIFTDTRPIHNTNRSWGLLYTPVWELPEKFRFTPLHLCGKRELERKVKV